jgi:hypothetical protein
VSEDLTPEGGTPDLGPCPKCIAKNRARFSAHRPKLPVGRMHPSFDGSVRCEACDEWFWPVPEAEAVDFLFGDH